MSAARQCRRAARRDALAPQPSRAERFAARRRGQAPLRFDALRDVPLSRLHPDADLSRVALAAGLLHYRHQLDAELSGARLLPIVALCGEDLVDRVCAAAPPPPDQCATAGGIPDAEALLIVGRELLGRTGDARARSLAARAFSLVADGA